MKYGKYTLAKFASFVYFALRTEKRYHKMVEIHRKCIFPPFCNDFVVTLFRAYVIQKYTKFANFASVYFFRILQHFATKLGNFTDFKMLFLAVVKGFILFAKMKIQFKRGIVD